jgi:hypothetical protein
LPVASRGRLNDDELFPEVVEFREELPLADWVVKDTARKTRKAKRQKPEA